MNNLIVLAAAGSRKTTFLVEESLRDQTSNTLLLTYTIENLNQIKLYLIKKRGVIPKNVDVMSWYSFLLRECVRPYQNYVYDKKRIASICFVEGRSTPYIPKENIGKYFFLHGDRIFTDKVSEFACRCNIATNGLVIERLEQMYKKILIDESQDLAGYDFNLVEMLLRSKIDIFIVGDSRQATYFTNCSPKNKKFKGQNIISLFRDWERNRICSIEEKRECYRCNQLICDFADGLYMDMPRTTSKNEITTDHDGVFIVKINDVYEYYRKYTPVVLKYSIKTNTLGLPSMNFGVSKGQSFDRVLIFPNVPIKKYLKSGDAEALKPKTRASFYVAITRARYSVAFVYDQMTFSDDIKKVKMVPAIHDGTPSPEDNDVRPTANT